MKSKLILTGLTGLTVAVLAACGGGGGDSTKTVSSTKVSGTAATGAALAGATVTAKCASGSGSATTAADGTFTINIENAQRPCVLSVTTPDGTTLHSVVEAGSENSVVANVTPFTELITAALAQGSTNTFFEQFDANAQARLTSGNLATSTETVRTTLSGLVDLTGFDPLKGALVAANNGKTGNALDQLLDQLGARLKSSGATVGDLSTAIGSNAGTVAIGTILQKASATCAGLRTGDYFMMGPGSGGFPVSIDADGLTLTPKIPTSVISPSASIAAVPMVANTAEACRFDIATFTGSLLVSKSGVGMLIPSAGSVATGGLPALIVPAQKLPLAELAGNWNALTFDTTNGTSFTSARVSFTLDANGKMTAAQTCNDDNACTAWTASELPTLTQQADGSYLAVDSTRTSVAVGFKSTDGVISAVISKSDGIMVAAKENARALPVVGSTNAYWDYVAFGDTSTQLNRASTTILSVDVANSMYTRKRNEDGRLDTWKQNFPTNGLRYRAKSAGADEAFQLTLGNTGVGVNIGLHVSKPYFDISVGRP